MIKSIMLTVGVLSVLAGSHVNAQTCKSDSITPTHPEGQYLIKSTGVVTDIVNGVMFQICSVGQTYNDAEHICEGEPTIYNTWSEALNAAQNNKSFAGYDNWKLPNIKELSTLVERSCVAPAINLEVFISTPSAVYWSSTFDDRVNVDAGIKGRIVDFTDGTEFLNNVNTHRLIRLMRPLSPNEL
jgi:hypothetical protein